MKKYMLASLLAIVLGQAHGTVLFVGKAKYDEQNNEFTIVTLSDGTKCIIYQPPGHAAQLQCNISNQPAK